jgi:hypothetical protein
MKLAVERPGSDLGFRSSFEVYPSTHGTCNFLTYNAANLQLETRR